MRSEDTDPEADRAHTELLRRAGSTRRAEMALELSAAVIDMAKRAIERSMPGASRRDLDLRFVELYYGRELAQQLRDFLDARNEASDAR